MDIGELNSINKSQINHAGARYTPGIDPEAPNIEIAHIIEAFDALSYSNSLRNRLQDLADSLENEWENAPDESKDAFKRRKQSPQYIARLLRQISRRTPGDDEQELYNLTRATRFAAKKLDETRNELSRELQNASDDEIRRDYNRKLSDHQSLSRSLSNISSFVEGPESQLLRDKILFLKGEWGTGKTHFLCDLTEQRMENGLPTLLILAESLPDDTPPLEGICNIIDFVTDEEELLTDLQNLGEEAGGRSLLIIDGINEGDRSIWRDELSSLSSRIEQYSHVGMALSCRTPFDRQIVTNSAESYLASVEHYGFQENEFDAQSAFFEYYQIPSPHVPFLSEEFSRPLFLKILCEAIAGSSRSDKRDYLEKIASGQRGMTHVLEHFARELGEEIEEKFDLERKTCWYIIKGSSTGNRAGIAGIMADELRDHVTREEALDAIIRESGCAKPLAANILEEMILEGLLAETLLWENSNPKEAVRFPYQRFGDHIIARHLLAEHLNTTSEESIRRSFYVDQPLGRIFRVNDHNLYFEHPGLAQAVMLEFPERVKRVLPKRKRELAFYIPKKRRLAAPMSDVFLEGLYWRSSEAFSEQTYDLVEFYLDFDDTRNQTYEVLVGLASRPGHPFNAIRLYDHLREMTMPDRDESWSEFIRYHDEQSNISRVLEWVESAPINDFSTQTARNTIILLSTFLTTTNRFLRDRVTKALYELGLEHPDVLFQETFWSLSFNDPYLPERMLASCYGISMALWADPNGRGLQLKLPLYAHRLIDEMFRAGSPYSTKHILIRQYASGIVELGSRLDKIGILEQEKGLVEVPLTQISSPFADPESIDENDLEKVEPAFHMDFSNYTVGSLVPDRGNYEDNHPEYRRVFKQIKRRVHDLGYTHERFESIDDIIQRRNFRVDDEFKIDRYGKKYSWIAYFEMYGDRVDEGHLPTWDEEIRPTDCDIDPSFPPDPQQWKPPLDELPTEDFSEAKDWIVSGPDPDFNQLFEIDLIDGIEGSWILLDGYIEQADPPFRLFSFLRGLLVDLTNVSSLEQCIYDTEYPGNHKIPDPYKDLYTYAGEIPWSAKFGPNLRDYDGSAQRNIGRAFNRSVNEEDGIPIEIPVHKFSWESYHSRLNQVSPVHFVAPAMCEHLELVNHAQSLDLFDKNGEQATVYREFQTEEARFDSWLLYIREDLLRNYLNKTNQTLVWVPWGERDLTIDAMQSNRDKLSDYFNKHVHVHKKLVRSGLNCGSMGTMWTKVSSFLRRH